MNYKDLEVWRLAREVVIEVHAMSLQLPKFEQFEEAQQIRRSSKTTKACIVEGYGRRRYKQDWIKFLVYAISSNDETLDHLENLWDTHSLTDEAKYTAIEQNVKLLGKKLNSFLQAVELQHQSIK
ncbi:four helix bundle protein [Aridibaculum aurantiacum]|uniref:four helix bundle protein n=1 Tax=Aridibaculum aurantiacum TaxID=2810307 RepID=UPI001A97B738|nr:four helix bundle protein [Aridibaculum aurantiacum]